MKIVFLERDSLGTDVTIGRFKELGELAVYPKSTIEETKERAADADIIVVNKIPMNSETLANAKNLKLICVSATGTNNIDFEYMKARGIEVRNVAGYSTEAVVQHTFAMFFYVYEHLNYYDSYVKYGRYEKSGMFSHFGYSYSELSGKTWGIIGLGSIGSRVAEVASAFGCKVIYYSTSGKNNNERFVRVSLHELLSSADVISIHCPLNEATKGLIGAKQFEMMKKTAFLLNLGRGGIVDEHALFDALVNEKIAGAALDVLEKEPISEDNPLYRIKDSNRLLITPHMGWGPREARQRCVDGVLSNIMLFLNTLK